MGKKGRANFPGQICPNEKWELELCILMVLKMKDDNLSELQASVLVFFILSTKSYWAILVITFTVSVNRSWLELYDQYVIDFDIDFKSH